MKLGVSSYSFSQAIGAGRMTQADAVEKSAEMGFDGVEFIDLSGDTWEKQAEYAKEIRERAEKAGIEICAYTVGANLFQTTAEGSDREVERLCRQVDIAALLGAPVMRHDACWSLQKTGPGRSFDGMLPTIAQNARRITEYAAAKGIRTCTENHGFIAQDSDRMERLFCAVGHDNYGLLVDVGNFTCADEAPEKAVSRVAPYAFHVHAKDMLITPADQCKSFHGLVSRGGNLLTCCTVGEGSVPVKNCLRILRRAGYDGFVSLEYEGREDCFAGISRGAENLRRYLAELDAE